MGRVDPMRRAQIRARLSEICDELAALQAEIGESGESETPEQRRRGFRIVDGGREPLHTAG